MKRLAAMQDCPLLMMRALTAVATASSRFALGITINGSLPPSSSTTFLIRLAAPMPTCMPAPSLPVSVAATTRGSVEHAVHLLRADQQRLKRTFRKSGAAKDFLDLQRALRNVRGVLQQPNVASHQTPAR